MRSRDLIKLLSAETGIPDRSNPERVIWKNARGQLHRDFGPACVCSDGTQAWWKNGKQHRDDGPAVVRPNGAQAWYRNGLLHRDDGPAFVGADGTEEWYRNGERIR